MKRMLLTLMPAVVLISVLILSSGADIRKGPGFPEDVSAILEKSCFGCHSTGAKAKDAVDALDFLKWDELSKIQKVSALNDIKSVVKEETMPPERFLEKYPDKALSDKEGEKLIKWTKKEISVIMGDSE